MGLIVNCVLGAVVVVVLYVCWKLFRPDPTYAPPRFKYLSGVISGAFDMKNNGPLKLLKSGYDKCGDVYRLHVLHERITVMIGLEAQRVFFEASDEELAQAPVYKFTIPVFGKNIVYDAPPKVMNQHLKFLTKGVMASSLNSHCSKMVYEADNFFAKWGDSGEIDLYSALSDLTILTASRCLLGREIRETVQEEFGKLYHDLSNGMSHLSIFFPYAPTEAHKKRDAARAKIVTLFSKVIQERRRTNNAEGHDDFLQCLIDSRYKDGSAATDDEITGLLLSALFAGQHTSNITGTWTGFLLLTHREKYLQRLLDEQRDVLEKTNGEITLQAASDMELLHNCVLEALRLHPTFIALARRVMQPLKYKDYIIPKGDIVVTSPPVAHKLPEVFKDPEQYDPDRFAPPRLEDEKGKWSFIAFGGGRHACLGRRFALLQIKAIWSVLVRKFDIELVSPYPKVDYGQIVTGPTPPCIIRYKRKPAEREFIAGRIQGSVNASKVESKAH